MKRTLKILAVTVGGIIALVVVLVATIPLWIGTVARPAINGIAPTIVKTGFGMERLYLNPYSGRFELGGLKLENHAGYAEKYAATVDDLVVDVDMRTLNKPVIHIEEACIDGVFISYLSLNGTNNLDAIYWKLCGGRDAAEAKSRKSAEDKKVANAKEAARRAALTQEERDIEDARAEIGAKNFCIDHLRINGVKVKLGFLPIAVPTIDMHNLGTNDRGVTMIEVWNRILNEIMKSVGNVAGNISDFGREQLSTLKDFGVKGLDRVNVRGAADAATDAARKTGEKLGTLGNSIKGMFK